MKLTELVLIVLKMSISLSVLELGLRATLADATSQFRRPVDLALAFLSMNVVMPLFAMALAVTFNLYPAVKIALVALSVSPVPPLLPQKALKKGGREDYTIGLLVAMALLAIVVIPITMEIFQRLLGVSLDMSPRSVAVLVVKTIMAPLLLGLVARKVIPTEAERVAKSIGVIASVLLAVGVVPVLFASARNIFSLIGNGTILVLAGFAVVGLISGHSFVGPDSDKKRVLSLATSSRHPGIAAAIAQANFPNQKLVIPAISLYLIVSAIIATLFSARSKPKENLADENENQLAA